ncbi:hypothetical protein NA57DRAFT_75771 [Rhizodiscina lignyota]|uniref:Uncharacterized protein n=1 Tax=Rhizodiscina lignyota TaxID=1504668 RepID=A0A9P4M593_9PEZI|nr:hypothetical protein NA57DRAFT_75771 [Rhizodiscina lignyota]
MSDQAKGAAGTESAPAPPSPTERRRSSGQMKFAGLMAQKRDPSGAERRASIGEQNKSTGVFGKMWNEYAVLPKYSPSEDDLAIELVLI